MWQRRARPGLCRIALWIGLVASCSPPPPRGAGPAPAAASLPSTRHAVVRFGKLAGHSTVTAMPDGSLTAVVEDTAGPNLRATLTLAPDGTIARLASSGRRMHGVEFAATFSRTADRASWTSAEETGERAVTGPAFYIPADEIPDLEGWLIRAALAHGGAIPLLPGGIARVERTGEVEVAFHGERRTLTGYAIVGLDLMPVQNWMNPDGSWFGFVSDSFSVVPEGAEEAIATLVARQDALFRARDARLAAELGHRPPGAGLAYQHVRVLDVEHGRWLDDRTVVIAGDRIASVGPAGAASIPAGAEVVDATGKAMLPGLIDMHARSAVTGNAGALHVAAGVTTVRDLWNVPDDIADLQRRYDAGTAVGPHVVRFGRIDGVSSGAASGARTIGAAADAAGAVAFYADRHYDGIALWSSTPPELVSAVTAAAHRAGLPVVGVPPAPLGVEAAVRAGYDGIERISIVMLDLLPGHATDARGGPEFAAVGDLGADLDPDSAAARDLFGVLRAHRTVVDPLDNMLEHLLVWQPGQIAPGLERMVARLPVQVQRVFLTGGAGVEPGRRERYRKAFDQALAMTRALHAAGVPIAAGTNGLGGLGYHHELALLVRAGIPSAAVLRIATLDAARSLGREQTIGSIAPGKLADLVIVDGDPLARIDDLDRTVATVRGGVVYPAAPLFASAGIAPAPPR